MRGPLSRQEVRSQRTQVNGPVLIRRWQRHDRRLPDLKSPTAREPEVADHLGLVVRDYQSHTIRLAQRFGDRGRAKRTRVARYEALDLTYEPVAQILESERMVAVPIAE